MHHESEITPQPSTNGRAAWLYLAFLPAVVALLIARAIWTESKWIAWATTQWLFNYEDGFSKRGLAGEVLRQLEVSISPSLICQIYYAGCLGLTVALLFALYRRGRAFRHSTGWTLLCLLILTNPGTLQHFYFDAARFDPFLMALAAAALVLTHHTSGWLRGAVMLTLMCSSILIHEAAAFMTVPLIAAYALIHSQETRDRWILGLALSGAVATTVVAFGFGTKDAALLEAEFVHQTQIHGPWVTKTSLDVVYQGGVRDNLSRTLRHGFTTHRAHEHLVFFLLTIIPLSALALGYSKWRGHRRLGGAFTLMVAAAFCPLLLYPIGHDHFRWWSLALSNLALVFVLHTASETESMSALCAYLEEKKWAVLSIVAMSIVAGPIGATHAFLWH